MTKITNHKHKWSDSKCLQFCENENCDFAKDVKTGNIFDTSLKENQAERNDKCECGHILGNHNVDVEKTMKSNSCQIHAKCKFCKCEDMCIA